MATPMTVELTEDESAFVQRLLDEGTYPSVEAIIDHALELVGAAVAAEASGDVLQGSPEGDL